MARKGKRGGAEEASLAPEDTPYLEKAFREQFARVAGTLRELEEQNAKAKTFKATHNNAKKALYACGEKLGYDKPTVDAYLILKNRTPDEIDRETRLLNKLCAFMGLPLGSQLGLFDDGRTVATVVDTQQIDAAPLPTSIQAVYDLGYNAGNTGGDHRNPYPGDDAKLHEAWQDGWDDGQRDLVHVGASAVDAEGAADYENDPDFAEVGESAPAPAEAIKLPAAPKRGRPSKAAPVEAGQAAH